uniref:hypothetical protein n=1 Tax=Halobacterium sp. (strain GN101) TaxID=88773 RepID=UPI00159EE8E0|nr:hypothetical protein [Halobacterium sp. GN101]
MTDLDNLLIPNRELNRIQLQRVQDLVDEELTGGEVYLEESVRYQCVDPDDADYQFVHGKNCDASFEVEEGMGDTNCPGCDRHVDLSQKTGEQVYRLGFDESKIRDYVRRSTKALDGVPSSITKSRHYITTDVEPILNVEYNGENVLMPLLLDDVSKDIIDCMFIYNEPLAIFLTGNSIRHKKRLEKNNIPYITFGELVSAESTSDLLKPVLEDSVEKFPRRSIEQKADAGIDLYERKKESLTDDDFERIVQVVLKDILSTSVLYEEDVSGVEVPDGALTLNWKDSENIYVWDAKFVENWERGETKLAGEYHKIKNHLDTFQRESDADDYGGLAGFIIFSPQVKLSNLKTLKQRLEERGFRFDSEFGTVCHFPMRTLLYLHELVDRNYQDVKSKQNSFRKHLHRIIAHSSNHVHEPEEIEDLDNVTDVSKEDIDRLFNYYFPYEKKEFEEPNKERYLRNLESVTFD